MSIEKIERVYQSLPLHGMAVPKVAEDDFSSRVAANFGQDEFRLSDTLRIQNNLLDQLLDSKDLDGDGLISPHESLKTVLHGESNERRDMDQAETPEIRIVAGDYSGLRLAQDSDQDGFLSLDELKIENKIKDLALGGADLDGDGLVSMKEAILASKQSSPDEAIETDEAGVTQVEIIAADHSSSRLAQDVDGDGFLSLDELKIKNKVKDRVFEGADLDGDGLVSMREAILTTKAPSSSESPDMKVAQAATDAVVEMLVGDSNTSSEFYTQYIAELVTNLVFSQTNVRELIDQMVIDADLNVLA